MSAENPENAVEVKCWLADVHAHRGFIVDAAKNEAIPTAGATAKLIPVDRQDPSVSVGTELNVELVGGAAIVFLTQWDTFVKNCDPRALPPQFMVRFTPSSSEE